MRWAVGPWALFLSAVALCGSTTGPLAQGVSSSFNPAAAASDTRNPSSINPAAAASDTRGSTSINPAAAASDSRRFGAIQQDVAAPVASPRRGVARVLIRPAKRISRLRKGRRPAPVIRHGRATVAVGTRKKTEQKSDAAASRITGSVCQGC